jgi:hypothetical protein
VRLLSNSSYFSVLGSSIAATVIVKASDRTADRTEPTKGNQNTIHAPLKRQFRHAQCKIHPQIINSTPHCRKTIGAKQAKKVKPINFILHSPCILFTIFKNQPNKTIKQFEIRCAFGWLLKI